MKRTEYKNPGRVRVSQTRKRRIDRIKGAVLDLTNALDNLRDHHGVCGPEWVRGPRRNLRLLERLARMA